MSDPWAEFRVAPAANDDPWAAYRVAPAPEAQPSLGQTFARNVGIGTRDVIEGAGKSLPAMLIDALREIGPRLPGTMKPEGGSTSEPGMLANGAVSLADMLGLPKAETSGEKMRSAIVQPVTGAVLSMGAGAPMAASTAAAPRAVGQMLMTQPGTQLASAAAGGAVSEATDSPAAGMLASMATPFAIAAGRRVISPIHNANSPGRQALVAAAEREGIPVTAGQATGSRFLQNVEHQFEQLPFTAGPQRAIREEQNRRFIAAAMRRTGADATDTLPTTINPERARIGGTIGEIANRNTLRVTPELQAELQMIDDSLRFIPAEAAAPVRARLEQFRGMSSPSATPGVPPTVPGASYRMMDSALGRSIKNTSNGDVRAALGDLREKLRTAMDASISPADADAWNQARRQYANLMVISDAAGRAGAGAAEGMMSPLALRQALDASTGRGYVYGRGDLNELARIGQAVVRPPPDSGTAGRSYANSILTGSLVAGGAGGGAMAAGPAGGAVGAVASLALPRVIQMVMNSKAGQAYLRNQMLADPTLTRDLARALLVQELSGQFNAMPTQ